MENPIVVGVVSGAPGEARVGYLKQPLAADRELLALADPRPTEVFRLAATCMGPRCVHQIEGRCSLADRIVRGLAPVSERAPPCTIRSKCVWWNEHGLSACVRCPQVVTTNLNPTDAERIAAGPHANFEFSISQE